MTELGCGTYVATIAPRGFGGTGAVGEFNVAFSSLDWNRVVDDTSTASVSANGYEYEACCQTLVDVEPARDELVIYRDGELVWVGPVTLVEISPDIAELRIEAHGLSWWWGRRRFRERHQDEDVEIATIAQAYHDDAMSIDSSMNVTFTPTATGITATRTVKVRESRIVSDAMRELMDTGLDFVDYGPAREIRAGNLEVPGPIIPLLIEQHFRELPRMTFDGTELGTRWRVTGFGQGKDGAEIIGTAEDTTVEPTYGVHDRVESEGEIEDQTSADAAAATRLAKSRVPVLSLSDGALLPEAPFGVNELVAGVGVNLRFSAQTYCHTSPEQARLGTVSFFFDGADESVSLDLIPEGTV